MSKLARLVVLSVGLASLSAALSASAGAVTWDNSASTAFTATAGAVSFSSTGALLGCTGLTATGTAPASSVGVIYKVSGTITGNGCSLSGISSGLDCGYSLTASTQSGAVSSGSLDLTCGLYQFGAKLCHIGGSVSASYTNPVAGIGVLTLATGGALTTSNGPTGTCPLGPDDRLHLSEVTFRTTSANPPVLVRTP